MKNPGQPLCLVAIAAIILAAIPAANAQVSTTFNHAAPIALPGAPVGVRVYLQTWNPEQPSLDTPTQVLDQAAAISGPMNTVWNEARAYIADPTKPGSVPALLSKGGLIAKGVNLYDIRFTVNPLSAIDMQPGTTSVRSTAGGNLIVPLANTFTVHWKIPGTRLEFKATTPDIVKGVGVSGALDPDLSAQIDLDVTLGFAVADTPGQAYLQVTEVQVLAANVNIDSGNLSGDVLVGLTNFLTSVVYGKSFNALLDQIFNDHNLAADPAHGGFAFGAVQTIDLRQMANDRLQPLNSAIAASGVNNYLHTGLWVKSQGNGKLLTLLFAPKALPLPPLQGTMTGTLQFDAKIPSDKMPASCKGLLSGNRIDVSIQTGPRKVLNVEPFSFGEAPMQRLGNVAFNGQSIAERQCTYTLSGLALLYPNNIVFPPPALGPNGSLGQVAQYLSVTPQNWASPVVPMAANHDLIAKMSMAGNPGVGAQQVNPAGVAHAPLNQGDPARWGTQNAAVQRAGQPVSAFGPQAAQPGAAAATTKVKAEEKLVPTVNGTAVPGAPGSAFNARP